jgi:hypothetical protein
MSAVDESSHSALMGEFIKAFNARSNPRVYSGHRWVRMRPPDADDLDMVSKDPRVTPFLRVGSSCSVIELKPLTVRCGGDSVIFSMEYFLTSFVRLVEEEEWRRDQSRWGLHV